MDLITFECSSCRQILKVGADKVGRQAKCPRCAMTLQIPSSSTVVEPATPPPSARRTMAGADDEVVEIPPTSGRGRADDDEDDDRPRKRRRRDEEDDEDDRPRKRRRDEEADDDDDRPRRRRRRDEEDDEDDRPRRRRRDEDDDDERPRRKSGGMKPMSRWPKVQVGILICAIAACVMTATWGIYLIGDLIGLIGRFMSGGMTPPRNQAEFEAMIRAQQNAAGWLNTAATFLKIGVIINLLGAIGGIVGYVFNIFVPNKRGATGLAIAVVTLGGVDLILLILFRMLPTFGGGFVQNHVVLFIFILLYVLVFGAEFILLYLLMSNISSQWKQRGQARDCINLVVLVSVGAGLLLLAGVMSYIAGSAGSQAMAWIGVVLELLGDGALVGVFSWSIPVLFRTKDVID